MPVAVESNVSLARFNTFGVEARALRFARIERAEQLPELLANPALSALPRLVLGVGSHLLLTRDFDGLVIKVEVAGLQRLDPIADRARIRVGAGENWHATWSGCSMRRCRGSRTWR